jgi:hypothetical protein
MTRQELASRLRSLAAEMQEIGTAMDYYGGLDSVMANNGRTLVGAGFITLKWADDIDEVKE